MVDHVAEELREARNALSDAAVLKTAGRTARSSTGCNACFHATQAVLYSKGFEPRTHQGVVQLFGQEIVKRGDARPADGRFLNEPRDYREQADYRYEPDRRGCRRTVRSGRGVRRRDGLRL
ncbi:toxin-antitoxin system, antitoxin component [Halobacteriales archaeon QS_4_69_34]|nr:MAG: toxin-antitoxin system, antitoxin component [Halobacteriales archaeon QS_4_69_34]